MWKGCIYNSEQNDPMNRNNSQMLEANKQLCLHLDHVKKTNQHPHAR